MRYLSPFRHVLTAAWIGLLPTLAIVCTQPENAQAQQAQNRVLWQLNYDASMTAKQKNEVEAAMLNTLSRAKERHFVGDSILTNKIKKEGLNFPECFTEGSACHAGGAFVLDVHNVDAYAHALFNYQNGEWGVELKLYRNLSASAVELKQQSASLNELIQMTVSSLFELEAGLELTSQLPEVEIYIQQKFVGTTPMTMKLPTGAQKIILKKTGYVTQTWEFEAEKGKIYSKNIELIPEETQLTVLTTVPDAEIWIDGQFWAKSNETKNILPGDYNIEVRSETHHSYSQPYKVYTGSPQTIHVAPLPHSEDPYRIRHNGIKKYRLSASLGYHFGVQKMGFEGYEHTTYEHNYRVDKSVKDNLFFHGISMAFNYEAEYWGIAFFRFDVGASSPMFYFTMTDVVDNAPMWEEFKRVSFDVEDALFIGFYPAQFRGHYTFWVMQAEATFGLGLSHLKLGAEDRLEHEKHQLSQTAFSLNFNVGLKYFFSEESYLNLTYDLQYDVLKGATPRHGFTFGLGMQIPAWMRTDDVDEVETSEIMEENDELTLPQENDVINSDTSDWKLNEDEMEVTE